MSGDRPAILSRKLKSGPVFAVGRAAFGAITDKAFDRRRFTDQTAIAIEGSVTAPTTKRMIVIGSR
jgi:hypothetical protein